MRSKERRVGNEAALFVTAEDRGEVEAEAVDMPLGDPVPQAIDDVVANHRMVAVHRVPAAGKISVNALVVAEHVIDLVVQTTKIEQRPMLVAFGGVVEDNIENDLDSGAV